MLSSVITPRRLETLRWYARRPRLWREFFRFVQDKRRSDRGSVALAEAKQAATTWAEARARSQAEAVEQLTGSAMLLSLAHECPAEFEQGQLRQQSCPVKMGSGAAADLLYTLAEFTSCIKAVETGVAFGWSSFALLQSLAKRGGRLVSTDMPYPLRNNDAFVGCVVPARLHARWTLLRAPDRDALPPVLRRFAPIDFCHYDSDKSEAGRAWAYPRLWAALAPGGMFVTDDVQDNLAFARFAESTGQPPVIVRIPERDHCKYAGILTKPRNPTGN